MRWISARIAGEKVELVATGRASGTAGADFDADIAGMVTPEEPLFVLFATELRLPKQWILVAWVPDTAAPRLKMLYSSSREDLKTNLGIGLFAARDFCANQEEDLRWAHVVHRDEGVAPLSEAERLLADERKLEKETSAKMSGMASVPFLVSESLERCLADDFTEGSAVEITLDGVTLDGAPFDQSDDAYGRRKGKPSFVVLADGPSLVYYCPDDASLKLKMTYATAKATLLDILHKRGIKILKSVEARDDLALELARLRENSDNDLDDRQLTHQPLSKPTRPGRPATKPRRKKWTPPS